MRKLALLALSISALTLCGCESLKMELPPVIIDTESESESESKSDLKEASITWGASPKTVARQAVSIDWQFFTCEWEEAGSAFRAIIKVSPWLNINEEDSVSSAWREVNNGRYFPNSADWDLDKIEHQISKVYFRIGEISIENLEEISPEIASADSNWLSLCKKISDENQNKSPFIIGYFGPDEILPEDISDNVLVLTDFKTATN